MGSRKAARWLLPILAGFRLAAAQTPPTTNAWNLLHTGASDSKPEVRQQAAAALGSMTGIEEAVGLLEKLLGQDEDADVRQTAAAGLGAMKARTAIPYLKDAIDDPDLGVSYAAVRALWDMGDISGRQYLEQILSKHRGTSTGGLHKQIEAAKRKIHSPAALARITLDNASGAILGPLAIGYGPAKSLLKDSGATNRAFAADLLSRHCNDESRQVLEERMTAEGNLGVKTAIARALAQCGDKQSLPILEAYLSDSRDALKFMAAASIIRLNQSKTAPTKTIRKKHRPASRQHASSSSPPGKFSATP
jgi:HEAT repeat protein